VRWTISDTGQSISNTPPDFRSGPIQFLESGLYTISAEAVSETAGSVPDDCGQIVLNVNVDVDDDFELGEGEARLTQTPPDPDAPPTPEISPTPTTPPVTMIEWQPIDTGVAVCPDWITYHTDQTGDWEIFRLGELPPDWNGDANLSQGVDAGDVTPSRSPDARWIAFTSDRDGNPEIYVAAVDNLDNPAMRRLTFNPANDVEPVWSPDGRYIVFTSDRNGNAELYIFDLLTGEITRATDHPADDVNPQWSPDSARILFQSNRDELWQIYEYTLESGDVQRLTDVNANVRYPLISPDGERITVTSDLNGENALYIVDENGGIARLLTLTLDPEYAPNQTWSDDGRLLAYHDRVGAVPVLFVYDTATDTTRQLFEITATSFAPNWICDSYTLVFTSTTFGQPDLFTIDATPADLPNPPLLTVRADAQRLTTSRASDLYPRNLPVTEDKIMLLIAGGLAGTGEVVAR
jgi:Tol biopolymer transport system component